MLDERLAAFGRRGMALPAPMGVADSWFGDSKRMQHVRDAHQGTLVVEGKASYCCTLADGHQIKGHDLIEGQGWRWYQHPGEAGVRYVRLRATSPTYGPVTVIIVDEPGQDRFYLLCLETERSAPQVIRRWRRRSWIEFVFRTLKHLLATEACQVHSADAYYGHLVLPFDAVFRVVLHLTGDLQGAIDDGGDHLQSETLLAFCRLSSPGITRTFMGC